MKRFTHLVLAVALGAMTVFLAPPLKARADLAGPFAYSGIQNADGTWDPQLSGFGLIQAVGISDPTKIGAGVNTVPSAGDVGATVIAATWEPEWYPQADGSLVWTSPGPNTVELHCAYKIDIPINEGRQNQFLVRDLYRNVLLAGIADGNLHTMDEIFSFPGDPNYAEFRLDVFAGEGQVLVYDIRVAEAAAVPLPGALLLLGSGLVRLAAYSRRRKLASNI